MMACVNVLAVAGAADEAKPRANRSAACPPW